MPLVILVSLGPGVWEIDPDTETVASTPGCLWGLENVEFMVAASHKSAHMFNKPHMLQLLRHPDE